MSFFKPLARKEKPKTNNIEIDKRRVKEVKNVSIEEAGNGCSENNLKRTKKKKSKRKEKDAGEFDGDVVSRDLKEEVRNKEQNIETIHGTKEQEVVEECPNTREKEGGRRTKKKKRKKEVPGVDGNFCVGEVKRSTENEELNDPIKAGSDADAVAGQQVKRKKRKEKETEGTHDREEDDDENCNAVRNKCKAASNAEEDGKIVEGHLSGVGKEHADKKDSRNFPKKLNPVCSDFVDNSETNVLEGKEEHDNDFEVNEGKVKRKKLKKRVKNNLDSDEGFVKPIEKKKLIEKSTSKNISNDVGDECLTKKVTKKKSKKMKRNDLDSDEEKLDSDEVKQICEEKGDKIVASDVENETSNDVYINNEDEEFLAKKMRKKLKKIRKEYLESEEEILIHEEEKPIHRKEGEIGFADNDEQGEIVRKKSKRKKKKKKHRFDSDGGDTSLCDEKERDGRKRSDTEIEGSHSDTLIEDLHEKNAESLLRLRPNYEINDNEEVEDLMVEDEISDDAESQCLTRQKKAGILDGVSKPKKDTKKTLERKEKEKSRKIAKEGESSIVADEALAQGKATRRSTRNRNKEVKYDFDEEVIGTESEGSVVRSKKSKIMKFEDDDSDFESIEDCKARMKGNRKRKENEDGRKRGTDKQSRREKDEGSEIAEKGKKTKGTVQSPSKCQKENIVQIGKGEADVQKCLGKFPSFMKSLNLGNLLGIQFESIYDLCRKHF